MSYEVQHLGRVESKPEQERIEMSSLEEKLDAEIPQATLGPPSYTLEEERKGGFLV